MTQVTTEKNPLKMTNIVVIILSMETKTKSFICFQRVAMLKLKETLVTTESPIQIPNMTTSSQTGVNFSLTALRYKPFRFQCPNCSKFKIDHSVLQNFM